MKPLILVSYLPNGTMGMLSLCHYSSEILPSSRLGSSLRESLLFTKQPPEFLPTKGLVPAHSGARFFISKSSISRRIGVVLNLEHLDSKNFKLVSYTALRIES